MRFFLLLALLMSSHFLHAQKESSFRKFGKITPELLQKKLYELDSSADAVVLSDIGTVSLRGNDKAGISNNFTRHKVVHILNKKGYDFATEKIPLYVSGNAEEKLVSIKAVTYNLEDGKIVETKFDRSTMFREKVSEHRFNQKFTFPNVKEGSIIEYEYTIISDFISSIDPWRFQDDCPTLWSELVFSVPEFYTYSFLERGYHPTFLLEKKERPSNFIVRDNRGASAAESYNISASITDYRWVLKDVPALKREPFTFSSANHRSRIEFQLISQNHPLPPKDFRTNWSTMINTLLESEAFGQAIGKSNNWVNDDIKSLVANSVSQNQRARDIFNYVRDHFTITGSGNLYLTENLRTIMKTKKGMTGDINLLLTALLRHEGLKADPVILSTTDHGYALEFYPTEANYNHIIVQCQVDEKTFYLDATDPLLGFGKLMPNCYNGHARVINKDGEPVFLQADSLKETQVSLLVVSNGENGKWKGLMKQAPGYFGSHEIRERIKSKGAAEFFKQVEKDFGMDVSISNPRIDSLTQLEMPVGLMYDFDINHDGDDVLYVNPLFGEAWKRNPFVSANRFYPVEMPYTTEETVVLQMEVPTGYVVEELPKQMLAKFDEEGKTFFEYRISQSDQTIFLRSRIKIDRTLFEADEYEVLREFFNMIVKKQNEQIVFKRKK